MQFGLLCALVFFAFMKIASTIWLLCQPDAATVADTKFGRAVYLAGKTSPALFVATALVRAWLVGESEGFIVFCAVALVASVVLAVIAVRLRASGAWYGLAHQLRQRRSRRRGLR